MLRFRPPEVQQRFQGERWPDFTLDEPSTVFSPRPALQALVVVIDNGLLEELGDAQSPGSELLAGLLTHPYIDTFRISDQGPPNEIRQKAERGPEFAPGWLTIDGSRTEPGHTPFTWATGDGKRIMHAALIGNAPDVAEEDPTSAAYSDLPEKDAAAQRGRDAEALEAAREIEADLFITERPYLHGMTWRLAREVLVATPMQALPLIGLYLRRQGAFITDLSPDGRFTSSMNRGLFYWEGTRDLLPAGRHWFSALVRHRQEGFDFVYLGQSLFQRVQRTLQARDAALWALNQPQNNDTAEDSLSNLDIVLLSLMAAVDVAARVAHRVLAISGKERDAGWQRNAWLKKVEATAPDLAAVIAPGTSGAITLEILRALRNSVHGAALTPLGVASFPNKRDATLVGLPPEDAERLLTAMDANGGRAAFGVQILLPDRIHADPGKLLDAVLTRTIALLNELMKETPVERLGAPLEDAEVERSDDPRDKVRTRENIRRLLGIDFPGTPA